MKRDNRKICIYNKKGELIKVARNKVAAANFAKTSVHSVSR